jgi:hypothetical protein
VDESFTGRFGTFLFDCEKERVENRVKERTVIIIHSSLRHVSHVTFF